MITGPVIDTYSLFFFFKQKTAYEMRISDWSSDVCSSDLDPHLARAERGAVDRDRFPRRRAVSCAGHPRRRSEASEAGGRPAVLGADPGRRRVVRGQLSVDRAGAARWARLLARASGLGIPRPRPRPADPAVRGAGSGASRGG